MQKNQALIGLPLPETFVPGLQKAIASLRLLHPKEKDGELLGRIFAAGILTTLNSAEVAKPKINRIIQSTRTA